MTREQIMALSGREFDAAVAEAMGVPRGNVRVKAGTERVRCWTENAACTDGTWTKDELLYYFQPKLFHFDANADYSVLEWMNNQPRIGLLGRFCQNLGHASEYKIGDYGRALLLARAEREGAK